MVEGTESFLCDYVPQLRDLGGLAECAQNEEATVIGKRHCVQQPGNLNDVPRPAGGIVLNSLLPAIAGVLPSGLKTTAFEPSSGPLSAPRASSSSTPQRRTSPEPRSCSHTDTVRRKQIHCVPPSSRRCGSDACISIIAVADRHNTPILALTKLPTFEPQGPDTRRRRRAVT